ncbi:hypothetical protein CR513_37928, partial [Mucuna pruriens]
NKTVKNVDVSLSAIYGIGTINLIPLITLHNVLHLPNLSYNLLSIRVDHWEDERDGLYYFDDGPYLKEEVYVEVPLGFGEKFDTKRKYIFDLLKETRMSGYRSSDTLIDPDKKLYDEKEVTWQTKKRNVIARSGAEAKYKAIANGALIFYV